MNFSQIKVGNDYATRIPSDDGGFKLKRVKCLSKRQVITRSNAREYGASTVDISVRRFDDDGAILPYPTEKEWVDVALLAGEWHETERERITKEAEAAAREVETEKTAELAILITPLLKVHDIDFNFSQTSWNGASHLKVDGSSENLARLYAALNKG